MATKLDGMLKQQAQLKAKSADIKRAISEAKRSEDRRKMIMIGRMVTQLTKSGSRKSDGTIECESSVWVNWLRIRLDYYLTRDADRELFGFSSLTEKATKPTDTSPP